jgi:hypothetical protein
MSEAAKAAKFPTSASPRQVLQKRPGPICCKYMGPGKMCRILKLWRCMRWQSWHRNVGRCGGQTGILADQDREAINAQQNQQVMHPDESAKVKASVDRRRSARCRWSTSARWTSECDVRKLTTGASVRQCLAAVRQTLQRSIHDHRPSTGIRSGMAVLRTRAFPSRKRLVWQITTRRCTAEDIIIPTQAYNHQTSSLAGTACDFKPSSAISRRCDSTPQSSRPRKLEEATTAAASSLRSIRPSAIDVGRSCSST